MRTIKTRSAVKNIKVLDKSVNLSKRMKDSFVRTKDKAEETQSSTHATPTDYASDNIQGTTQSAARETVYNLHTPRHKARENLDRAKGHFQEVKRQMPGERKHAAAEAQKTAVKTRDNADNLRKTADTAKDTARDAQTAVKDAKNTLREVRQSGQQTIREVKQRIRIENGSTPRVEPGNTGLTLKDKMLRFRSGKLKTEQKTIKTRDSVTPQATPAHGQPVNVTVETQSGSVSRPTSGASDLQRQRGIKRLKQTKNINPARSSATPKNAPSATAQKSTLTATPGKPVSVPTEAPKGSMPRPNYMSAGAKAQKSAGDTAKTLQTSAKSTGRAVKSTKKGFKETAKGTVKTAKRSVKTAEKSAKAAVKTAQRTAKTAQKSAKAAAKTAKAAERAARAAAKAAVQAAKVAVKTVAAMVKAAIAAVKGIVAAIAAGGWIAVLVILIICMIGLLVGSIFGIFFSSEPSANGQTINTVIAEIDTEYTDTIDSIIAWNYYDLLDMSGARASWKEVLAVYTVRTVNDPANPMEVATIDDTKAAILRSIFWEMNTVSYTLDYVDVEEDLLDVDGLPTGETYTVTYTVLRIIVSHKTPAEMAAQYGFTAEQTAQLDELLKPEYHSLWNALLYGITSIGDGSMISIAETQLGNVGGEPYWSWYGFTSRVEWCACFVSWVAEQCGFIDAGIIPRFSACSTGVQWFKNRGQWCEPGYVPAPGDIIFFDWEPDGECDHVGIVESVTGNVVNTIEGNSSDSCRRRSYDIDSSKIYGYGCPIYG